MCEGRARGRAAGVTCELREGGAGGWQGQAGLVEVRSERSRHGGWSGWSWRGEDAEGTWGHSAVRAPASAGLPAWVERRARRYRRQKLDAGVSSMRWLASLLRRCLHQDIWKTQEEGKQVKITCSPIGETDLRAVSRNSGRGRSGVRAQDGGLSPR